MKFVNENGMQQIKTILQAHFIGNITDLTLCSFAGDAEAAMLNGNPPVIEIPARMSSLGRPVTYTISDEGIDTQVSNWREAGAM